MKAPKNSILYELQTRSNKKGICPRCSGNTILTVEHIIPAFLLEQLGLDDAVVNDAENMELLCIPCNRYKAGRIDLVHPKTIPLLKKYINSL